jgi:methyl-accepting chemotaxis protein
MVDLTRREERAVERLLEDEALTAGLDDTAANELINWAIDCISRTFQKASGLGESDTERMITDRLSAIRRLMRFISRWAVKRSSMDAKTITDWTTQVLELLELIYSGEVTLPTMEQGNEFFIQNLKSNPKDMIRNLRAMIVEKPKPASL